MMVAIRLPFSGNYPVTQKFGENPGIYSRFGKPGHNGVDFGMPNDTPVLAAADGIVEKTGVDQNGYGNYVKIKHAGFVTLYAHLNYVTVKPGDKVSAGQQIGFSGNTGFSTGPHLHFELRIPGFPGAYNSGEVDPLQFLAAVSPPSNTEYLEGKGIVVVNKLNVRDQPNANANIIDFYQKGEEITFYEVKKVEEWVRTDKGWCARYYMGEKYIDEREDSH